MIYSKDFSKLIVISSLQCHAWKLQEKLIKLKAASYSIFSLHYTHGIILNLLLSLIVVIFKILLSYTISKETIKLCLYYADKSNGRGRCGSHYCCTTKLLFLAAERCTSFVLCCNVLLRCVVVVVPRIPTEVSGKCCCWFCCHNPVTVVTVTM